MVVKVCRKAVSRLLNEKWVQVYPEPRGNSCRLQKCGENARVWQLLFIYGMHFSKTYAQLLLSLPPDLRDNAIEYRQLKKLINKVVKELTSLGSY